MNNNNNNNKRKRGWLAQRSKLKIKASEVAACIGKNPFKPVAEVLLEKWKEWFPNDYFAFLAAETQGMEPQHVKTREVLKTPDMRKAVTATAQLYREAKAEEMKETEETKETKEEETKEKEKTLEKAAEAKAVLISSLRFALKQEGVEEAMIVDVENSVEKALRCENGIQEETKGVAVHERQVHAKIRCESNAQFYRYELGSWDRKEGEEEQEETYTVEIVGCVDGVSADGTQIVEVKTRQRRLFGRIPQYERIQVLIYMLMTRIPVCHFIERMGEDHNDFHVKHKEGEVQEKILPALKTFVDTVFETIASPELKRALLKKNM